MYRQPVKVPGRHLCGVTFGQGTHLLATVAEGVVAADKVGTKAPGTRQYVLCPHSLATS